MCQENIQILSKLFKEQFKIDPESISPIHGGGSSRAYFRLKGGEYSAIGVIGNDIKENECFFKLDYLFKERKINVPQIYKISENNICYLIQDLGDKNLLEFLDSPDRLIYAQMALAQLLSLQLIPEELWKDLVETSPFSQRLIHWDLNYFKYNFLKPVGIDYDEFLLQDDFEKIASLLINSSLTQGLMYRDFQSRNIMVKNGHLWFIDFQGARKGPLIYDAVSFIWQVKAPFSFEERETLNKFYADMIAHQAHPDEKILEKMHLMQVFRLLQAMGAYGFRGLFQKKQHFIESIPLSINYLHYLKEKGRLSPFPELENIAEKLYKKFIVEKQNRSSEPSNLTLTVTSFSYKKGYPIDNSGNGGGFIFDCRAIHNPGRYQEYKNLTGKDTEVVKFLEKTLEADKFIENALQLVKPSVERYIERGFTSLYIGFGCTGGQHRSVYCAEKFSLKIKELYPEVNVLTIHNEQKF
ncbi:MAG: phosphotransferase [Muribaculaceae bacterium]|nr:phosphotransferase [Muribaculaceae bacterium]